VTNFLPPPSRKSARHDWRAKATLGSTWRAFSIVAVLMLWLAPSSQAAGFLAGVSTDHDSARKRKDRVF